MTDPILDKITNSLIALDPVMWMQKHLTLDGKPYRINGNGYKPLSDIARTIGIKALEKSGKPIVICKGRQIGLTVLNAALEMYFMGSGMFGNGVNPPIRVIHCFPQLELANSYSKVKLNAMINGSIQIVDKKATKATKAKSYMQGMLDKSSDSNDSLNFKQFIGGNHMFVESAGLDGNRTMGKMISLDTDLPTPNGFIRLKDLKAGNQLFDERGNICNVVKLHPINESPESYKVVFDDGSTVDACADHLWLTHTKQNRWSATRGKFETHAKPTVKTTKEILLTLKTKGKNPEANHSILNTLPVNYPQAELPIDPYLLGLWLGDGNSSSGAIETADPILLEGYNHYIVPNTANDKSKSSLYRIVGLTTLLNKNKLLNNKHIPNIYLQSSYRQRLSLLQGMMDSDGSINKGGSIEYTSVLPELAEGAHQLCLSMGIKSYIYKNVSKLYGVRKKDRYRVRFTSDLPLFRLSHKKTRLRQNIKTRCKHRFIVNVISIPSIPMRCIMVDSPSHLFLITKSFIPTHNSADILIFDEIQKIPPLAVGNSTKVLTKAAYGSIGGGVQVYYGTPLQRGSMFWDMWNESSQQFYHLGCEKCKKYFPLFSQNSNDWEDIWLYGHVVRCTHCGFDQDKRDAVERGKWIASNKNEDCKFIGFHLNQLYMPDFTKEKIMDEKPGRSTINTERTYQNEVLGNFWSGDSGIISPDQMRDLCGDPERKFRATIHPDDGELTFLGIDIGAKNDLEQLSENSKVASQGQSYSTAVIITVGGAGRISIERAEKFKRNDFASKKETINYFMRKYSCNLTVMDLGFTGDLSEVMQTEHGDRFLCSTSSHRVNNHIKYNDEVFPKVITFEKDYWIAEFYEQMRKGNVRFPLGSYEQIAWLIQHCTNMEIKPSISRSGEVTPKYIKTGPNDGFMALLNAYIAYKFYVSNGFTIIHPSLMTTERRKPSVIVGYIPGL
jgi:thiol-disulfide isomerase/thioredoxin